MLLIILAQCLGGGGRTPPPTAATGFSVVGSDIVAPDHTLFRPLGANVGLPGSFDWRGKAEGHSADALAWGWNTVRLNVTCTNEASYSIRFKDGYPTVLDRVAEVVAEYTARHIVVIVACHDNYAKIYADGHGSQVRLSAADGAVTPKNRSDVGKTYQQQIEGFWRDMAARYKDNPYVWFNFWNEPFGNDNAAFVTMNTRFYRLVRDQGADNLVVVDLMNSGNDAGANGAKHVYDPSMGPALASGKCNVLFSLHAYGWGNDASAYEQLFQRVRSEHLALVVGEFGYKLGAPASDASRRAADAMFALAPKAGVGLLAWHATFGDGLSLKSSGDAFYADGGDDVGLSPFGSALWTAGHHQVSPRPFPGSSAASACATNPGS